MREGSFEVAQHAKNFAIGVERVRLAGQRGDVALHVRRCKLRVPGIGVAIGDVVEGGRVVRIVFQRALKNRCTTIEFLIVRAHPSAGHCDETVVAGIALEEIVHRGDG